MPRNVGQSYAMEQRKEFIRQTVIADGKITRRQVVDQFRISLAVVSMDFRLCMIRWPGLMRYDKSHRAYLLHDATAAPAPDAPPVDVIPTPPKPDTFFCQVGLKSGDFDSRIEFRMDGDADAMKRFIESWLALMATAMKMGTSK